MPERVDIVIVGAGAAGCAAAVSLPPGVRALLVDRADPAEGRCCGGLLAPDAQAALDGLGLELPEAVRVRPEPTAVHVVDRDSGREQTYRRDYLNVDRAAFDAWLLGRARERAELRPHTRLAGIRWGSAEVHLELRRDGRAETVRAGLVIGADGAASATRRLAFPDRPAPPVMLAIQERIEASDPPAIHEVLFASGLTSFYAWAIPKPGSVLVGAAFSRVQGARARFAEVMAAMRERLGLDGPAGERCARRLTRPSRRGDSFAGGTRILLAGEAAGLVSPSSGEGLSFALLSGAAAGRAVGEADPGTAYRQAFSRQARRVGLKRVKARVIFSPVMRKWAMRLPWCP